MSTTGPVPYLRVVSALAATPALVDRLRTEHVAGPDGLCVALVCGRPGRGTPYLPWPCPTRHLADLAADDARTRPPSANPRDSRQRGRRSH